MVIMAIMVIMVICWNNYNRKNHHLLHQASRLVQMERKVPAQILLLILLKVREGALCL